MNADLLEFSKKIEREFDFGDDQSISWFRLILRLLGW